MGELCYGGPTSTLAFFLTLKKKVSVPLLCSIVSRRDRLTVRAVWLLTVLSQNSEKISSVLTQNVLPSSVRIPNNFSDSNRSFSLTDLCPATSGSYNFENIDRNSCSYLEKVCY